KAVNAAPTSFSLVSPVNNSETKTVAVFNWNPSTDPDGGPVSYNLLIAKDDAFQNIVYRQEEIFTTSTFIDESAKLADLTKYYWKIQAVDAYGAVKESSESWSFTTNNTNGIPGIIYGIVMSDIDFSRVAGALVKVNDISALTNADGTFILLANAGSAALTGSHTNYQNATLPSMEVKSGQSTQVIITLQEKPNNPPVPTVNISIHSHRDATGTVTLSGTDANGDTLSYSIQSLPAHGKLYQTTDGITLGSEITTIGAIITNSSGKVIHVPNPGWFGTDSFNFVVSDGKSTSASTSLSIAVEQAQEGMLVITGVVQDGTGKKVPDLWVHVWSQEQSYGAGTSTLTDGSYAIQVPVPATGVTNWYELSIWSEEYLVPDSVLVKVQSNGVVGFYNIDRTQTSSDNTRRFKPVAGSAIKEDAAGKAQVDFTLGTGNIISGRVVNENNQGMPWVWVDFHTKDGTKWYGAHTNEDGYYQLMVAAVKDYVGVVWGGKGQYRTTFYKNTAKEDDATLVNASAGNVTDIDFMLSSGSKITGTISGLASGQKVLLSAWSDGGHQFGTTEVTGTGANPTNFEISGLAQASDYRLEWSSVSEEIPGGFYAGVPGSGTASGPKSWEHATLLSTLNNNVTGVDINLTAVNTKTLTVKIAGVTSGDSINANLWSHKLDKGIWKQVTSTSTEVALVMKGVDSSADDYRLFIGGPDVAFKAGHYKGDVSGTSIPTSTGSLVGFDRATLINMSSDQFVHLKVNSGRQLTVTVSGLKSGQKVWVDAFSETTGAWGGGEVKFGDGLTDKVVIKGLESADDYRVSIWGDKIQGGSYAGAGKSLGTWVTAELVDLTSVDASIAMAVSTGRSISGTVSGLKNKESAWIDAWSSSTFSWGGQSVQSAGGTDSFTITGLGQAADFEVKFQSDGYLSQKYASKVDTSTKDATEVNFTASTGGSISGSITGLNPFEWVSVNAFSQGGDAVIVDGVMADSKGSATYTLKGVPAADDYVVGLWRGNKGMFYSTTGATPVWDNHSKVSVSGANATSSIDFDLTAAGNLFYTLSGTVSGLPTDQAQVVEIHAWSATAGAATTLTGNGAFKLEGLPSGNYTVEVSSTGYTPQRTGAVTVSNGVVSQVTWTTGWKNVGTVAVTANTTGLNITLSKGYHIKGSVTNSGAGVGGVLVNAWSDTDNVGGSAVTNSKGEFIIKGLPNSGYRVDVWTPDGSASKTVVVNGSNMADVALPISKAGGLISGKVTDKNGGIAGGALVIAYDKNGAEKDRALSDAKTGAYTLDGLTTGDVYTVKAFSSAKAKAGEWTSDSGFASGTATAATPAATLDLVMN
ncbi:MAG: carboxypeptidase regulatory-like domain-containing protein, partial [Magnetococcales bacterium]|nr:carboxypeptidase regulatory-like domain-containing protein [Magnetococcales bacterium]